MTKRAQLGMAMFLISATVFFFLLILACGYFRAIPRLTDRSGWILTILLAASSRCLWSQWRWPAVALSAAFLIAQALPFGTAFSLLTAIHGLFILAGLVAIVVVPKPALRIMALYGYFFSAVWVAIISVASEP
jgi:heme/copper-type cytochrome/quinol oxidase subunit 3